MLAQIVIGLVVFVAGAVNAMAGGGTFLAFPALNQLGRLPEKMANIACTIGLWPGYASSMAAVHKEVRQLPRGLLIAYILVCLAGGTLGSLLLLNTSEKTFHYAIPWLLLFATIVFAMGRRVAQWAGRAHGHAPSLKWEILVGSIQFIIAVYGGYFGAGIGVLTLAGLSLVGLQSLHQTNVLKVALSASTNLTAAIIFLFYHPPWAYIGVMACASAVGGFVGMHIAQRLPPKVLRAVILGVAILLTSVYFWNANAPLWQHRPYGG